jgi:N-acetylneuraminic acid mutarotase
LGRAGAVSFVLADTFYLVGGKTNGGSISNEVWSFDLVSEQWVQKANLPFDGIWRGISFTWNNSGIIGLG